MDSGLTLWETGERELIKSRRDFLRTGTMVSISAAAALSFADITFAQQYFGKFNNSGFRLPEEALLNPLHNLRSDEFSQYIDMPFWIAHPTEGNLEVTLIEVINNQSALFQSKNRSQSAECFTLVFSGSNSTSLKQGQYTVTHEKIGLFELFLVPGALGKATCHYEALFNRL